MYKKYIFFVSIFSFTIICFSQTGPGGVGNSTNNGLWLKADSFSTTGSISSWNDSSGNNNNAAQGSTIKRPNSVLTSTFNGMPIVRFDGTNDEMQVPDANILDDSSGLSYFVVLRPFNLDNTSPRGILGKRIGFSTATNYSYSWFFHTDNYVNLDIVGQNDRFNSAIAVTNSSVNYILSFTFDGTLASVNRSKLYNGTTLQRVSGETSSAIGNGTAPLTIGALNENYGTYLGADYAEIIQYNYTLNTAERIIINNYLSAKYSISIASSSNYYTQDNTSNGNFDFNVAGIGRATDGSSHTVSKGSGIIKISNPSDLNNDEFLFWGENIQKANYNFTTDINIYKEFIDTSWRVSKRNNLGTVTVSVEAADLDFGENPPCVFELYVGSNLANIHESTNTYKFVLSNGTYTATNVLFNDGDYFKLAYAYQIVVANGNVYNGSGIDVGSIVTVNHPTLDDSCYKLLLKESYNLIESMHVKEIEIEGNSVVLKADNNLLIKVTDGITNNGSDITLTDGAQLIQTHTGTSKNTETVSLRVEQNSEISSKYLYNYFSSPVVSIGENTYTLASVMSHASNTSQNPDAFQPINYVSGLDGSFTDTGNLFTSTVSLADRWIYTYDDIGNGTYGYDNNNGVGSTKPIEPGKGFLFKGPGRPQNYFFVGEVNNGEYKYDNIPAGVNILLGNPYPSAFNVQKFLLDNEDLGSTIYLWQQADVSNAVDTYGHYSSGYNGDYATINATTSVAGSLPNQIDYILEAKEATLGGNATIVNGKVNLTTATDRINFIFDGLSKQVDSLFITYSSNSSKNLAIDINDINKIANLNLPSTSGALDTLKVAMSIKPKDRVLLKSLDANTAAISKVFVKQKYTFNAPPSQYLAIAQGFFFYTDSPGSLVFNNSQREFVPEGTDGSYFFRNQQKNNGLPILKLGMDFSPKENQIFHKQIAISFKEGNSFNYDRGYDSPKGSTDNTDIYWKFPLDENAYAIAGVQQINDDLEVPLELIVENSQKIKINIDESKNINKHIYIKDVETNTIYNITNETAEIQLDSGTNSDRFYLIFKETSLAIEENLLENSFKIHHDKENRKLTIKNTKNSIVNKVTIYTILGQKVIEIDNDVELQKKEITINTNPLSNTIYIINIETNEGKISKKFF